MGKGPDETFFQRRYTKPQQTRERCPASLISREMEIKPILHASSLPLLWLLSIHQKITSVSEGVEKLEPSRVARGNVVWCSCYGKTLELPQKQLKIEFHFWVDIQKNRKQEPKRTFVGPWSQRYAHNSRKVETARRSVIGGKDEHGVVYRHHGIVFHNKSKANSGTRHNTDES